MSSNFVYFVSITYIGDVLFPFSWLSICLATLVLVSTFVYFPTSLTSLQRSSLTLPLSSWHGHPIEMRSYWLLEQSVAYFVVCICLHVSMCVSYYSDARCTGPLCSDIYINTTQFCAPTLQRGSWMCYNQALGFAKLK